jgi:hypothetical protein
MARNDKDIAVLLERDLNAARKHAQDLADLTAEARAEVALLEKLVSDMTPETRQIVNDILAAGVVEEPKPF